MSALIVAPPTDTVVVDRALERLIGTRSTVADLEALWASPAMPSGDDLAAVLTAFPPSRRLSQDQRWASATWSARAKWTAGGLLLDGERQGHAGFLETVEGRTFTIDASLGTLAVRCHDQARRERALQADADRRQRQVDAFSAYVEAEGLEVAREIADRTFGRSITQWSRKSRARMVQVFASLDFTPMRDGDGDGAMVTLTYPGDWLAVVPNGRVAKRHLVAFFKRWQRDVGTPWVGLWKLEFQDRGAPHFHLYCNVPVRVRGVSFTTWLSQTWAKVVGASKLSGEYQRHVKAGTGVDFGKSSRMTDAKRLAVYFLKHGTKTTDGKEYQHNVPVAWQEPGEGPGRFWGYRGLEKPVVLVEVDERDFYTARRVLRRAQRGNAALLAYEAAKGARVGAGRVDVRSTAEAVRLARPRRLRSLGVGGGLRGGWVLVNDGVAAALDLARYLHSLR